MIILDNLKETKEELEVGDVIRSNLSDNYYLITANNGKYRMVKLNNNQTLNNSYDNIQSAVEAVFISLKDYTVIKANKVKLVFE